MDLSPQRRTHLRFKRFRRCADLHAASVALFDQHVYNPIHSAVQDWINSSLGAQVDGFINQVSGQLLIGDGSGSNGVPVTYTYIGQPIHGGAVPMLGDTRVIYVDGVEVWDGSSALNGAGATEQDGYVTFAGITGSHTWAWSS